MAEFDSERPPESKEVIMKRLKAILEEELEKPIEERRHKLLQEFKNLTIEPTNKLHHLTQAKLRLKSDIEAEMKSPLLMLPDDPELLTTLAMEDMTQQAGYNEQTLEVYKHKIAELHKEKQKFEDMITKATSVSEELDKVIKSKSEKDPSVVINRRYERTAVLFKTLRTELHFVITELFPPEEDGHTLSMEDLLERLITQMLTDPNNPYVDIDEDMKIEHINFLLRAKLVMRHPSDVSRIKFNDPRA
ncbi:hypothetical protein Pmani_014382 [Petrolisthes manimaculis]|uniref:Uncharacterized protein n=1 Tax=Petrolisthes manimaculis TaxID=1843537 RepID=A0AAE1UD63_9EUCA|nr:hypothetical protein Pmani_014382 [Petrolisthes manimaculis]